MRGLPGGDIADGEPEAGSLDEERLLGSDRGDRIRDFVLAAWGKRQIDVEDRSGKDVGPDVGQLRRRQLGLLDESFQSVPSGEDDPEFLGLIDRMRQQARRPIGKTLQIGCSVDVIPIQDQDALGTDGMPTTP